MSNPNYVPIYAPYRFALDLEDHFGQFENNQFNEVVDTISTGKTLNAQKSIVNLFKTLPKAEVVRRSQIVSRLNKTLLNVQIKSKARNNEQYD